MATTTNKNTFAVMTAAALAAIVVSPAGAVGIRVESGSYGDFTWQAQSRIVGVTSTALSTAGGDPRYFANTPKYSGVVALLMDYGGGQVFICSGSLLPDRRSIVTAAHCVSDGFGTAGPLSTRAFFNGSSDPDFLPTVNGASRSVSNIFVSSAYTGAVIDHNDIAVLRLDSEAPDFAVSYDLAPYDDLTGLQFNVAGYGGRSSIGGDFGVNAGTGRLRQGDNRMEFRVGDADFAGTTYGIFGPQSRTEFSYLADFDNGLAANDASCRFASAANFVGLGIAGTPKFCNLGVGAMEVNVAGGDSGGPQFDELGRLISVTSYGITFGTNFGDIRGGLNSSFGEMSGYVPLYLHEQFIRGNMFYVPEPGTLALLGLGLAGLGLSRRRKAV